MLLTRLLTTVLDGLGRRRVDHWLLDPFRQVRLLWHIYAMDG
jgi:hypothetical protein